MLLKTRVPIGNAVSRCIPSTVTAAPWTVLPVKRWKALRGAVRDTEMELSPFNMIDTVASFADAVIKCPVKSNLREKGLILAHSWRAVSPSWPEVQMAGGWSSWSRSIHLREAESDDGGGGAAQAPFSTCPVQDLSQGMVLPTVGVSSRLNSDKVITDRYGQRPSPTWFQILSNWREPSHVDLIVRKKESWRHIERGNVGCIAVRWHAPPTLTTCCWTTAPFGFWPVPPKGKISPLPLAWHMRSVFCYKKGSQCGFPEKGHTSCS